MTSVVTLPNVVCSALNCNSFNPTTLSCGNINGNSSNEMTLSTETCSMDFNTLNIAGDTLIQDSLTVDTTLTVNGLTTIKNTLDVLGGLNVTGSLAQNNHFTDVDVNYNVTFPLPFFILCNSFSETVTLPLDTGIQNNGQVINISNYDTLPLIINCSAPIMYLFTSEGTNTYSLPATSTARFYLQGGSYYLF